MDKVGMLNDYRNMTREVTESNKLKYMDMRQAFLDRIPAGYSQCSGTVTVDGEHPNDAGAQVEATLFAETLNEWLQ